MSAAFKDTTLDARKQRLCNLLRSMGMGNRASAELLRELGEELDPSERHRRILEAVESLDQGANDETPPKRSKGAERAWKSRQAKKYGLRVLREYPAVDTERLAPLTQGPNPILDPSAFERDSDLVREIVRMAHQLGDAKREA